MSTALDLINQIDTDAVNSEIKDLEARQEDLQKQIDALKHLKKLADIRSNGAPQRRPRQPRKRRAETSKEPPQSSDSPSALTPALQSSILTVLGEQGP